MSDNNNYYYAKKIQKLLQVVHVLLHVYLWDADHRDRDYYYSYDWLNSVTHIMSTDARR